MVPTSFTKAKMLQNVLVYILSRMYFYVGYRDGVGCRYNVPDRIWPVA